MVGADTLRISNLKPTHHTASIGCEDWFPLSFCDETCTSGTDLDDRSDGEILVLSPAMKFEAVEDESLNDSEKARNGETGVLNPPCGCPIVILKTSQKLVSDTAAEKSILLITLLRLRNGDGKLRMELWLRRAATLFVFLSASKFFLVGESLS